MQQTLAYSILLTKFGWDFGNIWDLLGRLLAIFQAKIDVLSWIFSISFSSTSMATFDLDNGGGNQQKTIYSALSYCQAGGMAS